MRALGDYLEEGDILLGVRAASRERLFDAIGRHMQAAHGVPAASVAAALARRELAASTALGHGVALPHARVKELDRILIVYARLSPALAFGAPDAAGVTDVVALMVPAPACQEHLDLLAQVAFLFADENFRKAMDACSAPAQVKALFERWPSHGEWAR